MTTPRTFRVKSSLADQMSRPGGRTVASALSAAGVALDDQRNAAMRNLADTLGQIQAVAARRGEGDAARIYEGASTLLDIAGFFDTGPLYEAAYSLCEISDRMQAANRWHWPSVEVHIQTLTLILASGCCRTAASGALLDGLRAVCAAVTIDP